MNDICVILNVYKRINYLMTQIDSIYHQTIRPNRIIIWNNSDKPFTVNESKIPILIINSSQNLGVWSRFTAPLLEHHKYYCVFDDDTFPGARWIENCISTMKKERALLGTIGLKFRSQLYHQHTRYGWANPVEAITPVDIVGHSWFFDRQMIEAFWAIPSIAHSPYAGEDIHFSYAVQRTLGLRTLVPPHPRSEPSLWGATPDLSQIIGNDAHATSAAPGAYQKFQMAFEFYLNNGFLLCN